MPIIAYCLSSCTPLILVLWQSRPCLTRDFYNVVDPMSWSLVYRPPIRFLNLTYRSDLRCQPVHHRQTRVFLFCCNSPRILYRTGSPRQPAWEEQVRSWRDTPPSQVREHKDHSLHWDQPPRSWKTRHMDK